MEQNNSYPASNTAANSHQWNSSRFEHDRNVSQRLKYKQNGGEIDLLTPPKIDKCLQVNFTVPAHSAYLSQSGCVNITCSHCKCVIELPEEFIVNLEHARNATKITNPKGGSLSRVTENRPNFTTESKLNESNISRVSTTHQLKNATSTKLYDSYSGENVVEQSNSKLPVKSEKTLDEVKEKSQNESIPSNNTLNDSVNTTKSQNLDVSEASNSQEKQRTKLYKDYLKQIKGREYKSIHEIMKEIDSKVKEEQHNMSVLSTRSNKSTKTEDAQNQTAPKPDLNKNQTQAIDSEVKKADNLKSGNDRGAGSFNEQKENFGENKTISHSNSLQKQSFVFTQSHVLNNFPIPKTVPSMESCENKENSAQKKSNTEAQMQKLEPEKWNASDFVNVNKVKNSSDITCAPTVSSEINLTLKKLDEGYIYSNDVTAPPIEVNKSQFHQSETQIPRITQNGSYVENAVNLEIDNQNQENWNKKYRNQEKRNQENGTQGNQNFNPDNQNQGYKIYENCNQENRNQENRNQENRNQENRNQENRNQENRNQENRNQKNRNQENRNQENRNQENCKQESSIEDSEATQPIDCLNDEEITRLTINGFITSTRRLGNNDNQNDDTLVKTNECNPQTSQNGNVSILELEKLAPQEVYVSSFRLKMQQTNRKPLPENSQHINESND
ncbi:myb-like protein X [Symsagittifera roscoffensis]|uniref:myb-like protein X n=1 Tax=Symsagittifera roscoffensis TaxID=84072 RepID=UPI00307BF17C